MNNETQVSIQFRNSVTNLKRLKEFNEILKNTNTMLNSLDLSKLVAIEQTNTKTKEVKRNVKEVSDESKKMQKNINTAFSVAKIKMFAHEMERFITTLSGYTKKSAEYLENWNLLDVAYQNNTKDAEKFVNTLTEMYGLDESWGYRTIGIFKQLSNAMGLSEETGNKLSKTLTQLAIDTSSLYNIDVNDTVSILQSGLAGQTKPVRRLGADITQTTLQTTLDIAGIDRMINQLSYAEKRLVIVATLLNQTSEASGDWGRTIESVANQMRIWDQQVERLTRELGNVFLPILKTILPYINAFLMVLVEITSILATLVGFNKEEFDFFGSDDSIIDFGEEISNLGGSLDSANESAKKLKNGLRGFDKLNNIKTPTTQESVGVGGGLGISSDILDVFNTASDSYLNNLDKVEMKATKIRDKIMEWLGFTKLTDETTGDVSFKFEKITGGSILGALAVGGIIFSGISTIYKLFKKIFGISSKKTTKGTFGEMMTGKTNWQSMSDGLGKMFKTLGTATIIISALGGIALVLKQITDLFKTLSESGYKANDVLTIMGATIGGLSVLIGALTTAVLLLNNPMALGTLLTLTASISAILLVMKGTLPTILKHVGNFVNTVAPHLNETLKIIFNGIENIINSLGNVLPPIINSIGTLFSKVFNGISKVVKAVGDVIVDILETTDKTMSNVLNTILKFISKLGTAINKFVDDAIKAVTKLINFLISGIEYSINTLIISAINALLRSLNKIPGVDFDPLNTVYIERFRPRLQKGLDFVPKNYFPAYLDYGERVLTKQENEDYSRGIIRGENAISSSPINATFIVQVGDEEVARKVLNNLQDMAKSNGEPITIGG